jgi:hypothetical protein
MTNDDHKVQLQILHAQIDRLTNRVLRYKQDIARHRRAAELMRALPEGLGDRIGYDVLDKLMAAEEKRAMEQATREFPKFMDDFYRCARQPKSR